MRRLILALVIAATPALAQSERCATCAHRSDSVFFIGEGPRSLSIALEGLRQDSNDVALLVRASRAELSAGVLQSAHALSDTLYARATVYARRAVALAPNDADSHFFLAAVLGRRALRGGGFRTTVPLAAEAYREASRALALDSMHAGAHEVIGKLHSEVRKLPWVVRKIAAAFSKLEVARSASWDTSERHLKRAIALDPTLVIAYVDLSQLYLRTGRRAEAVAVVEELEKMPRRTPVDGYLQVEARRRLGWYR